MGELEQAVFHGGVAGEDGKTYLLEQRGATRYGFISVGSHNMKHDIETIFYANDTTRHSMLSALLDAAGRQ